MRRIAFYGTRRTKRSFMDSVLVHCTHVGYNIISFLLMHYEDKEQLEQNHLEIVVYCHDSPHNKYGLDLTITSIQSCQYFQPRLLKKLIKKPNQLFSSGTMRLEEWYRLRIKQTGWDSFVVTEVENVSDSINEFHKLH